MIKSEGGNINTGNTCVCVCVCVCVSIPFRSFLAQTMPILLMLQWPRVATLQLKLCEDHRTDPKHSCSVYIMRALKAKEDFVFTKY